MSEALASSELEVVMFALEWCELCWAARRLFAALGVPCRAIDLDSVAYQANDWGGRIRRALQARTGVATIPQIFFGGTLIGGATDAIAAARAGTLRGARTVADPRRFLPGWLQSQH